MYFDLLMDQILFKRKTLDSIQVNLGPRLFKDGAMLLE